ncbi:immunoglobulin A1 protease [Streptococcus pneumoniae]|uniref:ZmpA/ZmpB/ZmpC family metallo-endopeptidase n=1 Tax=Streptococcus pneumoniae TaxID=1313 RepID=UPI0005E36DC6|nr:ZmpA/ZmpB/ZmpC family metallo-endopeptidase [Streptococcus pneumoniae]CEW35490.1 immunoglobulin A1 protease [Streptococcus pneumoniae]CGG28521.1 immunoglobulin A1 protease [Streptococcus pneumoniae]CIP84435.1 immunoglobulin A1 protease [Streptococcus pneumoniae]CIR04822.1 immunoglobulin A1 protease [Streptococcus pneumoniae]COA70772.1 immunoglobulin A1 protease [Streptococcus pneumoniae]
MEKYFGEKQERFSFRKLSVGLVSATISSLFFMSVLASSSVDAQETAGVHYKYVADSELSLEEKKQLVYDIPTYVENDDETYYLVYKLNSQNQLAELPNTGSKNERQALVAGASLAALGILIFAVSKKKVKNKTVLHLVLVAGIGNGVLVSVHALENHLLLNYNTDYELTSGEKLPLPKEISGYTYIGYIKEGKTTSDFEVSNQEKSAATPTKQQKVDYNVTPNFVDHPSTVQAIQEQTPVSSTKPTEVQVVEKPFSTELINPRKEEKQSSDSQEQLAEHKNLETKKEEKISPKEKTGANTLNPQDEVLSGQLNKPELLYREETIETKIDFQEEIQENPDLAEGTVRVKQEGKLGKKVEIVRIFSVNKEEVSREIVSTSTTAPSPRIVEKGTKKTQVIKEQPETGVEHKDVQSGAIVEPAIQPELPEAVVTDKGETEVQPESPDTVVSDKGEPKQVAPLPEYTGPQASAIVEPEQVAPLPEYTGVQAGSIVEPEKVEAPKEYTGKIEQPSAEDTKPENEASSTNGESERPKDKIKEEKQVDKKLELRNVSNVELYTVENNKYRHITAVDGALDSSLKYFMKVKSENFKDIMLPVTKIESTTKNNKEVYKIVAHAENLIQHENNVISNDYTYYLPKTQQSETGVYTSFKNLVDAMNSDPNGTFHLGATMDAREVELPDDQESYVKNEFYGKLIGENNGKYYAIYNLKKPLFKTLNTATIQNLSIKEANVSSKEDAATISKEAKYNTLIDNVHSDGIIAGERGIGGLVSKVDNSRISNSSFTGRITNTYDTTVGYEIGGLVGKLSGSLASIEKSIASIDIASNAKSGDQIVGGIAGVVEKSATIKYSYVEGNVNNVRHFGKVGGVAGNLWDRDSQDVSKSGKLSYVLSDVNVTNGNAISGDNFDNMKEDHAYSSKGNKVVNVVQVDDELVTKDSDVQRGTVLDADKVKEKKAELVSKHSTKVEDFDFTSRYTTIYNEVTGYQKSREQVYKNIEKLLPFYNRETIVKYGNLVDESSELFTKELLSVVPMKNNEVITDINKNKQEINKLLLHFEGNKSQVLNIAYKNDFSKVAEYSIEYQGLLYTPNTLLHDYSNIVDNVLTDLNSVQYDSNAIKKILDISDKVKNTELYLDEQFVKTKANIKDTLSKLLSADAAIAENSNSIIDNYVIQKIKQNKEALLLGLTYLERWYNFKYGETKAKDLVMYHLDFFGKSNSSALDNVIQLGKSGFNNLLAKNNVITYNVLLSKNYGTESLFKALEGYRKVFLPTTSNNEWFKAQTKAYIVEEKSSIPEVSKKQSEQGTKYSIGIYDRLTSPSWKYQSMVLPLLTLPEEKTVFMIANISTIGFGAYDRYRSKVHPKGDNLNKFVEDNVREAAKRFRDHYDYWYKILEPENREKLYRSLLVYDAFKFGRDNTEDKVTYQADFETDHPAIKYFFGPAGNNVVHNGHGAYATGDAFYYMAYRMLDKDGAVTYTHEMTHNSDREIYLGGYGRRSGLGPEFYAKGLLQAPDHPYDPTITINSVLKYDDSENSTRLQVADPTQRFNSAEDLHNYMHNMFDLIYTLEILEGRAVAKLDYNAKNDLLRKIENKYKQDPDGNSVYATNVVRRLTMDEVNKLNSFDSLIENDIITSRGYKDQEYKRNGYYTIDLFSPIYSALSGEKGTPGDLMGRRIAFELLAAKGYKEGMVPYISNQYEKDAKAAGSKIKSYGKEVGLVTDKLVLEKVFNNRYSSWVEFKKAMYNERIAKFNNLISVSFNNPNVSWGRTNRITITSIANLQNMINTAVNEDAEDFRAQLYPDTNSRVLKLKKAIYKAYLDQTNDFRRSIFENKK